MADNVCRVCMISSEVFEYSNLLAKKVFKNIRLSDAFELITGLDISDDDEFPKMICFRCEEQLQNAFHFRQLAESSSKHFAAIHLKNSPRILNKIRILNATDSTAQNIPSEIRNIPNEMLAMSDRNSQIIDVKSDDEECTTSPVVYNYTVNINGDNGHIEVRPRLTADVKPSTPTVSSEVTSDVVEITYDSDSALGEKSEAGDQCDDSDAISFLLNNKHRKRKNVDSKTGDNRRYECTVCSKKFFGKSNLVDHLRYHANIRNFKCNICDKSFVQSGSLKSHLRTHTAEKPFICTYCNKGFGQKSALTVHIRTHTQERNYVCGTCSKAFMTTGDLDKHKLIHASIKKFACDVCGMRSAQKVNIRKHRLKVHGLKDDVSCPVQSQ